MQQYRCASLFDLDGTLLTVNSAFRFGVFLYRNRFISLVSSLKYTALYGLHKMGCLSLATLHRQIFSSLFHGKRAEPLLALADRFVDLSFPSRLCPSAREALLQARQAGHYIAIVSSAPDFLVSRFAARLKANGWMGTPYFIDEKGCFDRIGSTVDGLRKERYLLDLRQAHHIDPSCVQAFSDSHLDIPFLAASGTAVGVNPDRKLRRHCERVGWRVLRG